MKKFNQKYLKSRNQGLILKLLKKHGPRSRAQISKDIGIVRSTVSEITNELVNLNIIYEGKKVKGNLGKRPTLLYYNKDFYYFIVVVITPDDISLAACNLNGEIIKEKKIKYSEDISARDVIKLAMSNIDEMISGFGTNEVCLISIGSPETFNIRTGVIKWAPYTRDWVGIDLKSIFEKKYDVDVIVRQHVKLETLGEHWKSFNDISNMIYLVITRGIGAGVVIDGKVREGKNGYLGEIAFLPLSEKINYEELKKSDKNLGYFESKCDIKKIETLVKEHYKNKGIEKKFDNFSDIARSYRESAEIKELINKNIIRTLALGIASTIIVLDPEIVVINGEIIELGEDFLNLLREEIYGLTPYKREIVFSKLKDKSGIYGAIRNGLNYIERYIYKDPGSFYSIDKNVNNE